MTSAAVNTTANDDAVLKVAGLGAGYFAGRPVVRGLDLSVRPKEIVALLGANGAGKTTTMLTIAGLLSPLGGSISIGGEVVKSGNAIAAVRAGLVLVPDDRSLFSDLTVAEHLKLAGRRRGTSADVVLDYFPPLRNRIKVAAGQLSGGEQQMLAIGRALMQDPKILLIDELSLGLAPVVVQDLLRILRRTVNETGAAAILVEQHVKSALEVADTATVMARGEAVLRGPAAELIADETKLERAYLGSLTND